MRGGRGGMEGQILPCLVRDALARWHNLHLTCGPSCLLSHSARQYIIHRQARCNQMSRPFAACLHNDACFHRSSPPITDIRPLSHLLPIETSEQSILWPSDCLNTCNRQCPRPWQGMKLRRSLSPAFRLSDLALRSNERIKFNDHTLLPNLQTSKLI